MKRLLCLLLTLVCCITVFAACNNGGAADTTPKEPEKLSITVESFQSFFGFAPTMTPDGSNYTFSQKTNSATYSGKANSKQGITEFQIVFSDVGPDPRMYLQSVSSMNKILNKSSGQLTMSDIKALGIFADVLSAYGAVGGNDITNNDQCAPLLEAIANGNALSVGGWTITVKINDADETVTISVTN